MTQHYLIIYKWQTKIIKKKYTSDGTKHRNWYIMNSITIQRGSGNIKLFLTGILSWMSWIAAICCIK